MGELMEAIFPFFRRFAIEAILLAIAIAVTAASLFFILDKSDPSPAAAPAPSAIETTGKKQALMVEVAGAVNAAGVYEMEAGSRLKDALTEAGGLSEGADLEYFHRNFNQARYLTDQEKIYVPSTQEVATGIFAERKQNIDYLTPLASSTNAPMAATGTVSINTAESVELETLPGVGAVTAAKIIQMRPYASIDELLAKKAVKKSVFDQIKNLISL